MSAERVADRELVSDTPYRWVMPQRGNMRVPGVIFASEALLPSAVGDRSIWQVANVASLPGIVRASYAMPDIHWGYGFPIGGVAATDIADGGVISPGGVGFDISCGVRLLATSLSIEQLRPRLSEASCDEGSSREVPAASAGHLQMPPAPMPASTWRLSSASSRSKQLESLRTCSHPQHGPGHALRLDTDGDRNRPASRWDQQCPGASYRCDRPRQSQRDLEPAASARIRQSGQVESLILDREAFPSG